jgi:tetratricopeptide (TPR) repeat protein
VALPTYELGPPEPNPIFYTQESYQGAQKRVYPYAMQDYLTHVRTNKTYRSLKLENDFTRILVLPEIGGRLFEAVDKSNQYDFFYRQHVIKPALIGMLGAWISGGIEWCAFHHHRNTTFMPVDYRLVENPGGSKTIWFGETERRHRMKWLIAVTLYPDRSYVEVTGKFFNRTAVPHSILYWANVAVHVNEDYQILFPPSTQVATYHSKIDFTQWPTSQVRYRGVDYHGVDLSWWKNHPEPNSFFAWDLAEDFMGGYDHGKQAGVVHIGDHHIVCGAKLWEWGTGPSGRIWDKILTDTDGPYAELMVGAYSDNQPDYSWIKPGEVKTFTQHWYPVRGIGGFKQANLEGAVNLELRQGGKAFFGFNTTALQRRARVELKARDQVVFERVIDLGPGGMFTQEVRVPEGTRETDLRASLWSAQGRELVTYQPVERKPVTALPPTVKPPASPKEIKSNEELYLTGLRVEQINSPSVDPTRYYLEALERDPGDSRANTMMGIHFLKRGLPAEAEKHLRAVVTRLSAEYTRLRDAEPHYYLGLALRAQGKAEEAIDQFYRAAWDNALHAAAYYQLAELSCGRKDYARALGQIDQSLDTAASNTKALNLKAAVLRKLGRPAEAVALTTTTLALDPLDFLALNEQRLALLATRKTSAAARLTADQETRMRGEVQSFLELAADYLNWGLWEEAIAVLEQPVQGKMGYAATYPLVHYYLGYLRQQLGQAELARADFARARQMPPDYCFPFRLETVAVLNAALKADPSDGRAWYYLGNLYYDLQPEKAIGCWEKSRDLDGAFGLVHRNLGWAHYRIRNNLTNAIASYETALAHNPRDPRLFLELDTLYEFANAAPERRLDLLGKNHETVQKRVETFTREIAVLVLMGKYDQAINHFDNHFFHVREGGGEIHDTYVDAHLLKGMELMKAKDYAGAIRHFTRAGEYPDNLSVGRPKNDRRAPQVAYYLGTALEAAGDIAKARDQYRKAAEQKDTGGWPETQYFQGLCWLKLAEKAAADKIFDRLIENGNQSLRREESSDFFAKFGEQETRQARRAAAHFTLALGRLGKGQTGEARQELERATQLNHSHVWARFQLAQLSGAP